MGVAGAPLADLPLVCGESNQRVQGVYRGCWNAIVSATVPVARPRDWEWRGSANAYLDVESHWVVKDGPGGLIQWKGTQSSWGFDFLSFKLVVSGRGVGVAGIHSVFGFGGGGGGGRFGGRVVKSGLQCLLSGCLC